MWEASCWFFGRKNNARIKSMYARVFHALVRIPPRRRMQEPLLLTERFFLSDKLLFVGLPWECFKNTVGEPFLAPGGKMLRSLRISAKTYCPTGAKNGSPTVLTQCVRKSSNTNLMVC